MTHGSSSFSIYHGANWVLWRIKFLFRIIIIILFPEKIFQSTNPKLNLPVRKKPNQSPSSSSPSFGAEEMYNYRPIHCST